MTVLKGFDRDGFFESLGESKEGISLHHPVVFSVENQENGLIYSKIDSVSDFLTTTVKTIGLPIEHQQTLHSLYLLIQGLQKGTTGLALLVPNPESPPDRVELNQGLRLSAEFLQGLEHLSIVPQFLDYR